MKNGTSVSRGKYLKDMPDKFGMEDAKTLRTHMITNGHFDLDESCSSIDQKQHRSMIGSLLYLTTSRSDIMFSDVCCKVLSFT